MRNKIKNEVIRYVSENTTQNNPYFVDVVSRGDIEFYNYNSFSSDYYISIDSRDLTVSWGINIGQSNNPENRILLISIAKLEGVFIMYRLDKHSGSSRGAVAKDINDVEWNFTVDTSNYNFGSPLYIKSIEFDVDPKVCYIKF